MRMLNKNCFYSTENIVRLQFVQNLNCRICAMESQIDRLADKIRGEYAFKCQLAASSSILMMFSR